MIRGISHIGIAVESIEESARLYETLGLSLERIEEVPAEGVRVGFIPCGDSDLELLEPLGEDSPIARFLSRRGPGIHHLCLEAHDVDASGNLLRLQGFRLLRTKPSKGAGGCWVQFVHPKSAGGVLLELAQHEELSNGSDEP